MRSIPITADDPVRAGETVLTADGRHAVTIEDARAGNVHSTRGLLIGEPTAYDARPAGEIGDIYAVSRFVP